MSKIILSRKGFDSSCGGYPSPILPDSTMISLSIPASENENVSLTYGDLKCDDLAYLDLMHQLGMKKYTENTKVHLDPDINFSVMHRDNKDWQAIFGQCDSSASHLDNQKVDKGDIFLFFGLFKKAIKTDNGYKFAPNESEKHILWGYMEIDEIIKIKEGINYPECYLKHPHFEERNKTNNTAYIATDKLSFNPNIAGAGVFKFNENLVLSCDPKYRTIWKLPRFFHPDFGTQITYNLNPGRWTLKDDCCILKCADRGQEFVISESFDVENWAKDVIINNC